MLRSRLPNVSVRGNNSKGLFDREMGPLQSQLCQGEYALLKLAPMLESEFVQISKRGEVIDVHNQVQTVTVGVACTSPNLMVPNVLLLARPILSSDEPLPKLKSLLHHRTPAKKFELTRLLPLSFVKISVHNAEKKQLRFKLASGRTFYLQLCPQPGVQEDVFGLWVKVVNMLRPPSDTRFELRRKVKDPGGQGELPPQKPQPLFNYLPQSPPGSLNLGETVSIRSVYSPSEPPSPGPEDTQSRRSAALSMGSQPSFQPPSHSPVASEGRMSEMENYPILEARESVESFERPRSPQSQDSEDEPESSPRSSRYNPEAQQDCVPHQVLLLGEPAEEQEPRDQEQRQRKETLNILKGSSKVEALSASL
ncbi:hypothetical protein JD844_002070 [Phrynosoma platyrhinos]|uniref:Golgi associated RAB2 interactor protein-like Rab2B-binding domain-containing protein n=1 Tax=Phrynosoma platyrhinos TaxID=52577 RepID=A0ABQ7TBA6_PHRPL|nr:hypothetical protein JD844_002070 [Phrynosoma platyrhinos]